MRILNHHEVRRLLPMTECMDVVEKVLKTLSAGDGINPLRPVMWLPEKKGALGLMPAYLGDPGVMGAKIISVFPGNHGTEFDSHQGVVLLFETEHGQLVAQMDGSEITAIRTAAASGVATRALAGNGPAVLAILGSGVQARTHLEAMNAVANVTEARVWSRTGDNATVLVESVRSGYDFPIEVVDTAEQAVRGATLVCTTTSSLEPIVKGDWLSPGCHINAVGACFPAARELDTRVLLRSKVVVDRMESALNEAGDFLIPREAGELDETCLLGELGDVLLGKLRIRTSPEDITLYKSLGIGVEDLGCAHHIYRRALTEDVGVEVDMGGKRDG